MYHSTLGLRVIKKTKKGGGRPGPGQTSRRVSPLFRSIFASASFIDGPLLCRGGLVFKAHRLCVSLNSRLESDKKRRREHLLHEVGGDFAEQPFLSSLYRCHHTTFFFQASIAVAMGAHLLHEVRGDFAEQAVVGVREVPRQLDVRECERESVRESERVYVRESESV